MVLLGGSRRWSRCSRPVHKHMIGWNASVEA